MSIKLKKLVRDGVTTDSTQTSDIEALETIVGDSDAGLVKDVADAQEDITALETTVGDSDAGLVKDISDITAAIGDEETADTILYRIKALEDAATSTETESSS